MPWSDGLVVGTPSHTIAASPNKQIRVVAGPGTGKSFAMKRRVARLLEEGVAPKKILPVTFTRVAAEDLHRELVGMKVPGCEDLNGTTLHSLAMRILMRNHVLAATGRTPRPLNDFEIKPLEADLGVQFGGVKRVRKYMKAYESAWARLQHDEPGFEQTLEDQKFSKEIVSWLVFHRAMLIGEVIPQLHHYLKSNPSAEERSEYTHILVDEFQDLNKAEQSVIDLISETAEICIVGDDDQSIYSFKHAHPDGIREWLANRPAADDIALSDCRRCPTTVVEMANSLIQHNTNRPVPRLILPMTENGSGDVRIIQYGSNTLECTGIANIVRDLVDAGTPPGDILILAQRGVIGTPIYEALLAREIPVRSYYAEAELDAIDAQRRFSILKLYVDRHDRVAFRWLLGLDSSNWRAPAYARIMKYCSENGKTPWETLEQLSDGILSIKNTNHLVEQFKPLRSQINELEVLGNLSEVVDHLFPEDNLDVRDLRALARTTIEAMEIEDRAKFLMELSAAISTPEIPSEIHDVRIMSLHKSKGLSAAVTVIAGCTEGLLPKQPDAHLPEAERTAELEEQRRLFYVGISRVKSDPSKNKIGTLILTYAKQMPIAAAAGAGINPASMSYGQAKLLASRFIKDMGPKAPKPIAG
jgi:superfamily I DNA/RNA helicase